MELVPTSKIQMLGVPLGSDDFVADFVGKELLPTTKRVAEKLANFEDPQVAMYLLRLSYGIIRANHFMRTTPLSQWNAHAVAFDEIIRFTPRNPFLSPPTPTIKPVCRHALGSGSVRLWTTAQSHSLIVGIEA